MSVAIVSSPVKPPASSTTAENASNAEPASSGADFASLLLGQLAASANLKGEALPGPVEKPDDAIVATDAAPQDAASMLAALGLTAPEPTRQNDPPTLPESIGKDLAGLPTPIQASAGASDLKPEPAPPTNLPTSLGIDGKPAKFAVPALVEANGGPTPALPKAGPDLALSKTEAAPIATLTSITQPPDLPTLSSYAPVSAENTIRHNEALMKVDTPVRDPSWASDFGQKVVWLAASDKQSAQLTLNPPHMGPIEISLNVNKDTASAFFTSPNPEVRETIEAALPRLRGMLAGVGIELGQTNVGAESFRQQAESQAGRQGSPRWMGDNAILGGDTGRPLSGQSVVVQRGNGMVDLFA